MTKNKSKKCKKVGRPSYASCFLIIAKMIFVSQKSVPAVGTEGNGVSIG